jgi:hypothetical protein
MEEDPVAALEAFPTSPAGSSPPLLLSSQVLHARFENCALPLLHLDPILVEHVTFHCSIQS